MEILIITGMSGAGKTSVVNIAQDNDYKSIDNLPPKLIKDYLGLLESKDENIEKLAFVIDIRAGSFLEDLQDVVDKLEEDGHHVKIVFIDANDDELIRRFQEKRRPHPYKNMVLENAIRKERQDLVNVRGMADYYIDTSSNNLSQLNSRIIEILDAKNEPIIKLVSFGFKYGILKEADFVFDARFIENPFYVKELKYKTGKDKEVQDYIKAHPKAQGFSQKIIDLIDYIAPSFTEQSKNNLLIGIGCTGGRHRSVSIAEYLYKELGKKYKTSLFHREADRW